MNRLQQQQPGQQGHVSSSVMDNFNITGLEVTEHDLRQAACAMGTMVTNISTGVHLGLWSEEAKARALRQRSEPEMVACMVAHCAKQVSLSTTEAASEWNNKMIEQDYHAKVSESRAFEEYYARCHKVVDHKKFYALMHTL